MSIGRRKALERLAGLARQVEEHLAKLDEDPEALARDHWRREVRAWLAQAQAALPSVGRKTAAAWSARIAGWEARLTGDADG